MSTVGVDMFESGSDRLVNKTDLVDDVSYAYVTVEFHRFDADEFKIRANGRVRVMVRGELDVVLNNETVFEELSNEDVIIARPDTDVPAWENAKENPTGSL